MASSKRRLPAAIEGFGREARNFSKELTDSVSLLKRTLDYGPSAGALEFKDTLADLEEEVAEVTQQVQHLERFTVDAISFEELLGHCMSVYQSNHTSVQQLEAHLKQYGYQALGQQLAPEDPMALINSSGNEDDGESDEQEDEEQDETGVLPAAFKTGVRMGNAPTTPHILSREASARLHSRIATPGMHLRAAFNDEDDDEEEQDEDINLPPSALTVPASRSKRQHTPAGKLGAYMDDSEDEDAEAELMDALASLPRPAGQPVHSRAVARDENADPRANVMSTAQHAGTKAGKEVAGGREPGTARKSARKQPKDRESLDSTPEAFMMSPSLAALQAKYGMEGSGGAAGDLGTQGLGLMGSDDLDADTPIALMPQQAARQPAAAAGLSLKLGGLSLSQPAPQPQQLAASHEDDTCALYAQLIRSKDVPSSIATHSANTANAAAAAQRASEQRAAAAAAATAGVGGQLSHRGSLESARKHRALASKLEDLQDIWVSSGQAALTPRRASKDTSGGGSADAPVAAPSTTTSVPVAVAPLAAVGPKPNCTSGSSNTGFAFSQPIPAASSAGEMQVDRSKACTAGAAKPTSTPAWPFGGSTATHATHSSMGSIPSVPPLTFNAAATPHDAALLAKYASASSTAITPSLGLASQNLSPGTAQLLSRVFANRVPPTVGNTAAVAATASVQVMPQAMPPAPVSAATPAPVAAAVAVPQAATSASAPSSGQPAAGASARPVTEQEYTGLPAFLRSQMPLEQLNAALSGAAGLGKAQLTMEDLGVLGYAAKAKVVVNVLVKLGRMEMAGSGAFSLK